MIICQGRYSVYIYILMYIWQYGKFRHIVINKYKKSYIFDITFNQFYSIYQIHIYQISKGNQCYEQL